MMLAGRFDGRQDVAGWLASEKYDGVRCFWDGSALRTRSWRVIKAPDYFLDGLPAGIALDGELWGGRGTFQIASDLARFDRIGNAAWFSMRFMVFDCPTTQAVPVEERIAKAGQFVSGLFHRMVRFSPIAGAAEALERLGNIVSEGGEGLVLRRPRSCYEFGRSPDWLKVKPAGVD